MEMTLMKRNGELTKWADVQKEQIHDHLNKARQVFESMENIKHQMDSLFRALGKEI